MACVSKTCVGYVIVTNGVITNATNTVFGINPAVWKALPIEGLAILKIRQEVPAAGAALPVTIAVPANSTVTTVGDGSTCCQVTDIPVVNPVNVAVIGSSMANNTERLLYFNKVKGILRLMDCCTAPTTPAA